MTVSFATAGSSDRPYGDDLADGYGAEHGQFVISRSLPPAEIAVTEINVVRPFRDKSTPRPRQDAYMIVHHFEDVVDIEYWEDGRSFGPGNAPAGGVTIHDLRREPVVLIDRPIHTLQWFVPRAALDALADEGNVPRIDDLHYTHGAASMCDDVISQMNRALLPALRASGQVNRLFVDHMTLAFAAHLACVYGGMQTERRLFRGGLAPWQERLAKDMLLSDLTGATPIADLAAACGLSRDHFGRAFRRSTGLPPHAWLNKARVERAMTLLRRRDQSLAAIALECGFIDQSHLTRIFTRRVGVPPGVWRRTVSS